MARDSSKPTSPRILAAGEVAAYSVCAKAWDLKWRARVREGATPTPSAIDGVVLHRSWGDSYLDAMELTKTVRRFVALLCCAVLIWMLVKSPEQTGRVGLTALLLDGLPELIGVVLIGLVIAEIAHSAAKLQGEETGLGHPSSAVRVDSDGGQAVRDYVSAELGLAGRPDAVVYEEGLPVPVERKPSAKKLRDRYVAQLLVYMRVIEAVEGKRPPHGYLLLGPSCRRVKIDNTEERQRWLDGLVSGMRKVAAGEPARATPKRSKCLGCDVREFCSEGLAATGEQVGSNGAGAPKLPE